MNAQLSFDLDAPRARTRDPAVSHSAAARAKKLQADHCSLILGALQRFGPMGVDKIASIVQLQGHSVGRRMVELQRAGAVELTGREVQSNSGRAQREWRRKA